MRRLLLTVGLFIGLLIAPTAFGQAALVYVTPTGATPVGNCTNGAVPVLNPAGFNNPSEWGSGPTQIGPGTLVLVCGIYDTGVAHLTNVLTVQSAGTSGNPVTIQLDDTMNITPASMNGTGIVNQYSNVVIDGGTAKTSIIQATLNGSNGKPCPGGTCLYQDNGGCIGSSSGVSNFTVKNVTCANMYVSYCPTGDANNAACTDQNGTGTGIFILSCTDNCVLQNNTVHDTGDALLMGVTTSPVATLQWINNTAYHSCVGIILSQNAGTAISGLVVKGNNIYDGYTWSLLNAPCHVDGIHLFNDGPGATATGTLIYDNWIHGWFGNAMNAFIFVENGDSNYTDGTRWAGTAAFNNIIEDDAVLPHFGAGGIAMNGSDDLIANNTFNGVNPSAISWTNANMNLWNNIIYFTQSGGGIAYVLQTMDNGNPTGGSIGAMDHNTYYGVSNYNAANGGSYPTLASWKTACQTEYASCDNNSTSTLSPLFSGGTLATPLVTQIPTAYIPSSSSAALILQGCNLTNQGIAALDVDYAGTNRPNATGCQTLGSANAWYIGAFNSTSNPIVVPNLSPSVWWLLQN